jgi:hypothetical protein
LGLTLQGAQYLRFKVLGGFAFNVLGDQRCSVQQHVEVLFTPSTLNSI